ncbi:uncharacterized protein [Venturia canescens]|uniref:uncharacterized protein n=1 Tax=Venturia canescens TaxID=32260 RepID=UPI001C9C607A|nr:uncharacterized protein LOC122409349 [Venturia canescens]
MKRQGGIVISDESLGTLFKAFGQKETRHVDHRKKHIEEDEHEFGFGHDDYEYSQSSWQSNTEPTPRKVVRVRVPVKRNRTERQHKYTVVRRRPLVTYVKPAPPVVISSPTARRIVITRVRPRGPVNQFLTFPEDYRDEQAFPSTSATRHRVTVTRRRKIRPTTTSETLQRPRVTRKKLVNVRPIVQPTPTFAIITTGFYSAPSSSEEEDDTDESVDEQLPNTGLDEEAKFIDNSEKTPSLEESPNDIDSNPENNFDDSDDQEPAKFHLEVPEEPTKVEDEPVIITDNFFFPASDSNDEDEKDEVELEDDDFYETTTGLSERESVTTEEPELTNLDRTTPETPIKDSLEITTTTTTTTTTTEFVTEFPETSTESTKATLQDQSEENTDPPTTVTGSDEINDQTEPTTLQDGMNNDFTTEVNLNKKENTYPEIAKKPVTIYIEEPVKDEAPETTKTPVTIHIDETVEEETPETTKTPVTIHIEETVEDETPETTKTPVTIHIEETVEDATPETTKKPLTITIEEEKWNTNSNTSVISDVTMIPEEVSDDDSATSIPITTEPSIVESAVSEAASVSPVTEAEMPAVVQPIEAEEEDLSVVPLESYEKSLESSSQLDVNTPNIRPSSTWTPRVKATKNSPESTHFETIDSEVPSVIPLEAESMTAMKNSNDGNLGSTISVTTSYASPTTEDIEAGLADDLYLSLSRPDFPQILPSKSIDTNEPKLTNSDNVVPTPELSTSVYYSETVVTSTKLRTYTYVVTKLNGLETEVTSSTTVRPRVTTLTLTVPVTTTISPTLDSSAHNSVVVAPVYSPVSVAESEGKEEEEGRRFNLATRVMSNGVEVIVAGPTPALRWENSNPQPTLTLSDAVVMLMPQDDPNEFVTKTCTTTFTYLNTITKDGATIVSTDQQVVANTATEERHRKTGTESASVTLKASPTLRTEVFKTTYTYLTLNTDHPDVNNALGSSMKVITNTVTAPQHYLDMLEPSEACQPETNTYLSTRLLEKTFMEDGRTRIETSSDTITQLIITESAPPPPRPTSVATTLTALDKMDESMTDITKTYFITYTYLNTYLEKGSTVIHTNIATSTDVVLEKIPAKKTAVQSVSVTPTPEPIQIFATKTYLTTFTYFTTLLQAGADGETATTISSRSHIVENVVTESIAPSLLDAGYMNALLTTAHHSDSVKNVVTGSTIIFFDEEDQIDPTTTSSSVSTPTNLPELESSDKVPESTPEPSLTNPPVEANGSEAQIAAEQPDSSNDPDNSTSSEHIENKRPSTAAGSTGDLQVSNLLSLGSLGINSLSALGPVITAMAGMAGLLQSKSTATRRNDTVAPIEAQEVTTQRSPIYIPVADFADGDIETAESQNIAAQLANPGPNYIPETRHKVAASLADGIPISPGEIITANSDVIIGKPGKLGPRPPNSNVDENIGMKPPPIPVPNIPVHPVLEVVRDDEPDLQAQSSIQSHRNTQIQILSAHQVYEKHLKVPGSSVFPGSSQGSSQQKRPSHIKPGSTVRQPGNKQDHLENDPLLIPPNRPNVEQYANPNINSKDVEWNRDRYRRPWSAKDPLSPAAPSKYDGVQSEVPQDNKPWPNHAHSEEQNRHPWGQKDPLQGETNVMLESSENKPRPSEPIIHQVPHVIDRSTGQPLLVNIQPSQVANVVIPQGGTQALIFGDTSEPHISGQYFDDPSPYPEPEVGPGFVGVEKIQDNPADYMLPPAPPISFKPLAQQSNMRDHAQSNSESHSQNQFNLGRPQDTSEITRQDKRPSEVLLIQRPDSHGQSSGQGHVHTEILVHHRPESVNVRPQAVSHGYQESYEPPRRDNANKHTRPIEQSPPRRSEVVSGPTDTPHQYIYLDGKTGNQGGNDMKMNWKFDRKPHRNPPIGRPDRRQERPSIRPHHPVSHSYPIFERPGYHPNRKPQHPLSSSRPHPHAASHFSANPNWYSPGSHEISKKPGSQVRPLSAPKQPIPRPFNVGHEINNGPSEIVPTGAIGYYNPSNDPKIKPIDTKYYPQLPTIKPEIQSFGEILPHPDDDHKVPWKVDTQTERTAVDDSVSDASESVVLQNDAPDDHQESPDHIDKQDLEISDDQTLSPANVAGDRQEEMAVHTSSTYDTVGSVNTVVGKPLDTEQSISYDTENDNPSNIDHHPSHAHGPGSPNDESYGNPIAQGKPYATYNEQIGHERPHDQHQHGHHRPDYEVIQGVPFSHHTSKKPSQEQRPTFRPYDHDDTIDLTPPAIIPHFSSPNERPGRPFSRPQSSKRPDSRPVSRPRPENDATSADKYRNRPAANGNQSNSHPVTVFDNSHGQGENGQESSFPSQHEWPQNPQASGNPPVQSPPGKDHRNDFPKVEGSNNRYVRRNQTTKTASYFPSNEEGSSLGDRTDQTPNRMQNSGTRVHPAYPHILTKPRPRVPGPITITSHSKRPDINNDKPKIQFSLPVEAMGEEKDSTTQTERPPSMLITANGHKNKKQKQETLETASQTNFATPDRDNENSQQQEVKVYGKPTETKKQEASSSHSNGNLRVPSQNMMPPPVRNSHDSSTHPDDSKNGDGLKPPPPPADVVGLSPPPVAITTTGRPKEDRFSFPTPEETDLTPPKYIPLKESAGAVAPPPPPPSTKMVPPSPRPTTVARPFLVDILSQDMVPPPLVIETSRPAIEIATVRPAIAVSGSIQIATAIAASHIPVMQDIEVKIPIIHGTVDLPVVMDVSEIMKPSETERPEHVSIYTVRPFETRPVSRVSVQPTTIITSNLIMPTKLRSPQISSVESIGPSISRISSVPTRQPSYDPTRKPTRKPDHPVFLEPSRQNTELSMKIEPTQSLIRPSNKVVEPRFGSTQKQKYHKSESSTYEKPTLVTRVHSSSSRKTNSFVPRRDKLPKTKEFLGTVIQEVTKNGTTATVEMKPKTVTHFRTMTVTRTETSVVGSPPTTRTLLLTHTMTSTIIETVTETLLRPTSVVVTSTVLQSMTRLPSSYDNAVDNDSIFVVMSDQNPPAAGAEEVEAEYGEEEVSRDEQEPAGNEIHRVLAGGILGAPVAPMKPPVNYCQPECKASKAEVCSEVGSEARCVCRPGFARMFPDRPCKPTYTYTVRVGLERMGREPIFYEAALNDTSSTAFRRLAAPTKEALDRTMMQSDLRDIYRSLDIAGFMPNPTQVEFHVQLTDNANETRLKDVLRKYLVGSNYSLGGTEVYAARDLEMIEARDFDECSIHDGGPHHDCSPHAACFNLRGSYQCSCKEGWADLSENPAYPGRICSQAPLGCAACNNKGHCTTNTHGQEICECFPWHTGQKCQINLKVLLIALVTTGAVLLGLLAVCLGLACFRHPERRSKSGDRRAMIPGTAGDTSSEGSVTDLAIPHHVPHILPPPPRTVAPAPPVKRPARKITPSGKRCRSPKKASITTGPANEEHCDRSLTVMIPRAKYRSSPQTAQNYKPTMSTFAADEHKLMSYLEGGGQPGNRKQSVSSTKDFGKNYDESGGQVTRAPVTTSGALVSAGFQVSATVTRTVEEESTIGRSCAETLLQVEPCTKLTRNSDLQGDVRSTLARSSGETSTSTKLLRLDFGDSSGSTLAKSCGNTTIQTSTKNAPSRRSDSKDTRDARDSGSEGHMTLERDLGSTLRLTPQHPTLYKPDRTSDRDSNFDSL